MKKIFSLLLCLLILLSVFPVSASAADGGGVFTFYSDDMPGYPYAEYRDKEACNREIKKVIVPENIVRIQDFLFAECKNLAEIKLHDKIQHIGKDAFVNTAYYKDKKNWENNAFYVDDCLIEVFPAMVGDTYEVREGTRLIADGAFNDCTHLKNVSIPDTIEYIDIKAFSNTKVYNEDNWKDSMLILGNVLLGVSADYSGEFVVPEGITSIADCAFSDCDGITSIKIADTVRYIGDSAFEKCENLESVYLGKKVESVGEGVFKFCEALKTIEVDSENDHFVVVDEILYDKSITEVIACPSRKVGIVVLPDTVTGIRAYSFNSCSALERVIIPENCVFIGKSAFWRCEKLSNVIIPDSMEYIDEKAFYLCDGIESVKIPDNVKYLGYSAFSFCRNLYDVEIGDGVVEIFDSAFAYCGSLKNVKLGKNIENIDSSAFNDTDYISNLENYKGGMLVCSDKYLIKVDSSVEKCVIPYGVTMLAKDCFKWDNGMKNLKEVHVPTSVERIEQGSLEILPQSVKIYYDEGFKSFNNGVMFDSSHLNLYTSDYYTKKNVVIIFSVAFVLLVLSFIVINYYKKINTYEIEKKQACDDSKIMSVLRILFSALALIVLVVWSWYYNVYCIDSAMYSSYGWRMRIIVDVFYAIPFVALFVFSILERFLKYINKRTYVVVLFLIYVIQSAVVLFVPECYYLPIFSFDRIESITEAVVFFSIVRLMMLLLAPVMKKYVLKLYAVVSIVIPVIFIVTLCSHGSFWFEIYKVFYSTLVLANILFNVSLFCFSDCLKRNNESSIFLELYSLIISAFVPSLCDGSLNNKSIDDDSVDNDEIKDLCDFCGYNKKADFGLDYKKVRLYSIYKNDNSFGPIDSFFRDLANGVNEDEENAYLTVAECVVYLESLEKVIKNINAVMPGFISELLSAEIDDLLNKKDTSSFHEDLESFARHIFCKDNNDVIVITDKSSADADSEVEAE